MLLPSAFRWSFVAVTLIVACSPSGASERRAQRAPDTPVVAADIEAFDTATVDRIEDTTIDTTRPPTPHLGRQSPLADSIAASMVFFATTQRTFLAASRAKRLLMDIGRIDRKIATPEQSKAYEGVVRTLSPVHIGDRVRLDGPWGSDDATVKSLDRWSGRIVAVLEVPHNVDSLARLKTPLVALATRADSAMPPVRDTCARDSVPPALAERIPLVRDSILLVLQSDTTALSERLTKSRRTRSSQLIGCFGPGRAVLFVSQVAGDYEVVHESTVLLDTLGNVTPLRMSDLRFKVHDAMRAMAIDSTGVDAVVARGHAPRIGGTVILRFNPARKRLEYVISGFAWENF